MRDEQTKSASHEDSIKFIRDFSPQEFWERYQKLSDDLRSLSDAKADKKELENGSLLRDLMAAAATDLQLLERARGEAGKVPGIEISGIALIIKNIWEERVEKGKIFEIKAANLDSRRYEAMAKEIKKFFDFRKEYKDDPGIARELGESSSAKLFITKN